MEKVLNKLCWLLEKLFCICLALAIIIITAQVLFRYVLKTPLSWSEQIGRYLFVWMLMLGLPVVYRKKQLMAFDLLVKKFKKRIQKVISIAGTILIIGFCIYFFVQSSDLCIETAGRIVPGIEIPYLAVYIAQPTCAVLMGVFGIEALLNFFTDKNKEESQ